MQRSHNKVILFPSFEKDLKKESLQALEEKRYSDALTYINKLFDYQVYDHELMIGKLICLIELGNHDQAEVMVEELLEQKNKHYYNYLHIYLSILFQTEKYDLLIDQINYELAKGSIPIPMKEQLEQLYNIVKQMQIDQNIDQSIQLFDDLYIALEEQDYARQWQLIENLRKMGIQPSDKITTYLSEKTVHPVIKTAIFKWLVDKKLENDITVHKFDQHITVKPADFTNIYNHFIMKEIIAMIDDMEQSNPSLFILLNQLLYRYLYVRHPVFPPREDITSIANALKYIGEQYLHLEMSKQPTDLELNYMKEIKMCEKLYLGVIEE